MTFYDWLKSVYLTKGNKKVTESTIQKYVAVISTVSKDMRYIGLIDKSLNEMTDNEYEIAFHKILHNEQFLKKDNKGNKMYSNGLKRYRSFRIFEADALCFNDFENEILGNVMRNNVLSKYNGKCVISHLSIKPALILTRIKPFLICDSQEKYDENNVFLLSATLNKLFNAGLITFNNKGNLIISSLVSDENRKILSLYNNMKTSIILNNTTLNYIKYHNEYIFTK